MSTSLELFIYIGIFAMSLGLLGCFLGDSDNDKRKLRAAHERLRHGHDPWDIHPDDDRRRRLR
jgi:hypothetical protein